MRLIDKDEIYKKISKYFENRIAGLYSYEYILEMRKDYDAIKWLITGKRIDFQWNDVNEVPPPINANILLQTIDGNVAEGEFLGNSYFQYRWSAMYKNEEITHWAFLPKGVV